MAISIDRLTSIISVPQADLTLISGSIFQFDTDQFRKDLDALADDEEGIVFVDTHIHNTTVTFFGTTFARTFEIISPYSVQFTPDSQYSVTLIGTNNNVADVAAGILVQNQVQVIPTNSGGLVVGTGSGLDAGQNAKLTLIEQILRNKMVTDPVTGIMTLFNNAGATLLTAQIFEDVAGAIPYRGKGVERRERFT